MNNLHTRFTISALIIYMYSSHAAQQHEKIIIPTMPSDHLDREKKAKDKIYQLVKRVYEDPLLIHEVNTRHPERRTTFKPQDREIIIERDTQIRTEGMVLLKAHLPWRNAVELSSIVYDQHYRYLNKSWCDFLFEKIIKRKD